MDDSESKSRPDSSGNVLRFPRRDTPPEEAGASHPPADSPASQEAGSERPVVGVDDEEEIFEPVSPAELKRRRELLAKSICATEWDWTTLLAEVVPRMAAMGIGRFRRLTPRQVEEALQQMILGVFLHRPRSADPEDYLVRYFYWALGNLEDELFPPENGQARNNEIGPFGPLDAEAAVCYVGVERLKPLRTWLNSPSAGPEAFPPQITPEDEKQRIVECLNLLIKWVRDRPGRYG